MFRLATVEDWYELTAGAAPDFKKAYKKEGCALKAIGEAFIVSWIVGEKPKTLLEFGHAHTSPLFEFFGNRCEMWGVDDVRVDYVSRNALEEFRKKHEKQAGARFITGYLGEELSELPDDYFDMVCSVSTVEHIPVEKLDNVFKEIARILKPGGIVANSYDVHYNPWVIPMYQAHLKAGLKWVDSNSKPALDWNPKYVWYEDPRVVWNYYVGFRPVDERAEKWPGNFATILMAARKHETRRLAANYVRPSSFESDDASKIEQFFSKRQKIELDKGGYRNRLKRLLIKCLTSLGQFPHCAPKEVSIPDRYKKATHLAETPVISIIMPSWNQGNFIESSIKSILNQNCSALEYIVHDSGSIDKTLGILHQYDTSIAHLESNLDDGPAHAVNLGFKHATGDIMSCLYPCDMLLPGALNDIADYFNRHPDVDVVYGHTVFIDKDGKEIGRRVLPPHDQSYLSWPDGIPQEMLFWRRRIWERVGGFVEADLESAMFWELLQRFRKTGATFARVPRFIGAVRVLPEDAASVETRRQYRQEIKGIRTAHLTGMKTPGQVKSNSRNYLFKQMVYQVLYRLFILRH
jgi:glycosyltransferase involved in cell wall biosynthesis/SAM-dependent methyltransferase